MSRARTADRSEREKCGAKEKQRTGGNVNRILRKFQQSVSSKHSKRRRLLRTFFICRWLVRFPNALNSTVRQMMKRTTLVGRRNAERGDTDAHFRTENLMQSQCVAASRLPVNEIRFIFPNAFPDAKLQTNE